MSEHIWLAPWQVLGYDGLVMDTGVIIPFLRMLEVVVWGSVAPGSVACSGYICHSKLTSGHLWQPEFVPRPAVEVKGGWGVVDRFLPRGIPWEAGVSPPPAEGCTQGVHISIWAVC